MNILTRLERLENQPGSKVPHFIVETMNGTTMTVHGYGLLTVDEVQVIRYDPQQECAGEVLALFVALHPEADICAEN